jgi:hypothetical protein
VRRHLERAHDAVEFRFWSKIAIEYAFGTPIKMQPAVSDRRTLAFITARGLPWEHDPRAQQEAEIIAAQARDDARDAEQKALEAAAPDEEGGEALELVRETGR